jgi:Tfp pilus assembly protein PilN
MAIININLVPSSLQKRKKAQFVDQVLRQVPLEIIIGIIGGVVIFLLFVHFFLQIAIFVQLGSHTQLKDEWTSMAPHKERIDIIMSELQVLRKKISEIDSVTIAKRILWSEKLNIISDDIPSGVWLEKISLKRDIFHIEGNAVSRLNDEMLSVSSFSSILKSCDRFMLGFDSVDVGSIQRRNINSVGAANFIISAKINEKFFQ